MNDQKQEDTESPEFSCLLSSYILQAKRLFETYSIVFEEPKNQLEIPNCNYVPIGFLCYTHFRFFAYQTLKEYIERVGFSSYEIIPQKTELPRRFRLLKYINSNDVDIESLSTNGFYVILTI